MKKVNHFFIEIKKEMKKVRWLTKKEMIKYSVAVLSIMFFFGIFFFLADFIIGYVKVLVG